jgi:hypothetical protein
MDQLMDGHSIQDTSVTMLTNMVQDLLDFA